MKLTRCSGPFSVSTPTLLFSIALGLLLIATIFVGVETATGSVSSPTEPVGGLAVFENAPAGASAGTATATGEAPLSWSLDDDGGGRFAIDTTTGAVTVQPGADLDTESEPRVNITVRVTDAADDTNTAVLDVDILNINESPVIGGVQGDSAGIIAGAGAQDVALFDDATVADPDSPDYNGGFLTIAQGSGTTNGSWGLDGTTATSGGDGTIAAGEILAVAGVGIGIVHATDDGQGGSDLRIAFNANASSGRIQALLRALTYSAPSSLGARSFTLTLSDGDGTANGGDQDTDVGFILNVTLNPPVVGHLHGDAVSTASNTAVAIDAGGNATVTDADSANFNGGNLLVARTSGLPGHFSLSGNGATGVSCGSSTLTADGVIMGAEIVFVDGVAIASISAINDGQGSNDLWCNLGSNATPARVQSLIRALHYGSTAGGAHTFQLTITDASVNPATSTPAAFTVTVNHAPVIAGQVPLSTFGTAPLTITLDDLAVTDADNSYPADFTLSVGDGLNYTRSDATIVADDGFVGDLAVPVSVSDGTDSSNTYNLTIYVATYVPTTRVVTEVTDSGPGSLRQALADAGHGDVIDLSNVSGTITLNSGPLIIDKEVTIAGAIDSGVILSGGNSQRVMSVSAGNVTLMDLTISDGLSVDSGGGIHNTGTLTLIRVTVSHNESTGGDGGGIYNDGVLEATNVTVSANHASGNGGGIAVTGTARLNHCTIADNSAETLAGGLHNTGTLDMTNSIVTNNLPNDCSDSGTTVSNIANLIEDDTCSPDLSGDPALGPLQDNFGSGFTHALLTGSPAIDAADPATSESTDQRGEMRPADGDHDGAAVADIGAYEYQPTDENGASSGRRSSGGGCFITTILMNP